MDGWMDGWMGETQSFNPGDWVPEAFHQVFHQS